MSGGIELQPNNQTQGVTRNPEQPIEPDVQPIEFSIDASGDENGAVFFSIDWNNRLAEDLRQRLTMIFSQASTGQNPSENLTNQTWNDFVNVAKEHENFAEFRRQPENFWGQVRQMSEPKIFKDDAGRKTRTTSRFDELLTKMQAKNLSPREFAETLPPNERAVFKACYQLRQTFGANLFNGNNAAANEAAQSRSGEVPLDTSRAAGLRESKFTLPGDAPAQTCGEIMFGAKSAALLGASVALPQNFKGVTTGNQTLQNAAPVIISQTALGSAAGASSITPENLTTRGLTNSASANTMNTNAAARRDGGTVIGGALISGAFAAIDNHKNTENRKIGDGRAGGNTYGAGGNGFASGATGAMFGAAIGRVIPGAGTVVSGVLGFVSSVVVGVDVDQGLRWLGASTMPFDAITDGGAKANNQQQLTTGNSKLLDLNLQPATA